MLLPFTPAMSVSPVRPQAPEGKTLSHSVLFPSLTHRAVCSVNMGKWMHVLQIAWPFLAFTLLAVLSSGQLISSENQRLVPSNINSFSSVHPAHIFLSWEALPDLYHVLSPTSMLILYLSSLLLLHFWPWTLTRMLALVDRTGSVYINGACGANSSFTLPLAQPLATALKGFKYLRIHLGNH